MLNNRNTLAEDVAVLQDLFLFAKHCEAAATCLSLWVSDREESLEEFLISQKPMFQELCIENFQTAYPALSQHILTYRIRQQCGHFISRPLIRTRHRYTKLKQNHYQFHSPEKARELMDDFKQSHLEIMLYIYLIYGFDDTSKGFLPSVHGYCKVFQISPEMLAKSFVNFLPLLPDLNPKEQLLIARFSKRFPGAFLFSEEEPEYLSLEQMALYLEDPRTDEQVIGIIRADMEALFYANEDLDRTEKNQTHDKFYELLHSIDSPPFYMLQGMVWTNLDEDIFQN